MSTGWSGVDGSFLSWEYILVGNVVGDNWLLDLVDDLDWIWLNFLPDDLLVWLLVLNNINVLDLGSLDWSLWYSLNILKWLIDPFSVSFNYWRRLYPFVVNHSEWWLWNVLNPFVGKVWLWNVFDGGYWEGFWLDSVWYLYSIVGWLVLINNSYWYLSLVPFDNFDRFLWDPVNVFNWNILDSDNLNWLVLNSGYSNWLLWD